MIVNPHKAYGGGFNFISKGNKLDISRDGTLFNTAKPVETTALVHRPAKLNQSTVCAQYQVFNPNLNPGSNGELFVKIFCIDFQINTRGFILYNQVFVIVPRFVIGHNHRLNVIGVVNGRKATRVFLLKLRNGYLG